MRKAIRSPLLALALIVVFAGTLVATGATGFHASILARGTLSESVHYNTGEVKFQTKDPVDFVTATVTIDPLGSSGRRCPHPNEEGTLFVDPELARVTREVIGRPTGDDVVREPEPARTAEPVGRLRGPAGSG